MKNTQTQQTNYEKFCNFLKTGERFPEKHDEITAVMSDNTEAITLKQNKAASSKYSAASSGSELFELFCANELSKSSGVLLRITTTKEEQIHVGDTELVEIKNDKMSEKTGNFYFELYEKSNPKMPAWSKGSSQKLGKDGYAPFLAIGTENEVYIIHKNVLARGLMCDVDKKEYKLIGTSSGFAVSKKKVYEWIISAQDDEQCAIFERGCDIWTKKDFADLEAFLGNDINEHISRIRSRQAEALGCHVLDLGFMAEKCLGQLHANPEHTTMPIGWCYNFIKGSFLTPNNNNKHVQVQK